MLIALTSERIVTQEASLVNQLFEKGLTRLHLRKPGFSLEQYKMLLDSIKSEYYPLITLHEHHTLVNEYKLGGIHLQEAERIRIKDSLKHYIQEQYQLGYRVSSSFHSPEAIKRNEFKFDYVFLSPIFNSISKKGYEGKGYDVHDLPDMIIGLGGINKYNLKKTINLGFSGVGLLGSIWNVNDPIASFCEIQYEYNKISNTIYNLKLL